MSLWNFFNGKKTVIGGLFAFISIVLSEVIIGIWGVDSTPLVKVISTLNWASLAVTPTGLIHKLWKAAEDA